MTRTDDKGRFEAKGLPKGEATVSARVPGTEMSGYVHANAGNKDIKIVVSKEDDDYEPATQPAIEEDEDF